MLKFDVCCYVFNMKEFVLLCFPASKTKYLIAQVLCTLCFTTFLCYFNVFNNSCYQVESSKKSTLAEGKKY